MKNKCDECGEELEKRFIMSEFNLPITVWVCPKSEIYKLYKKEFEKKYKKMTEKKYYYKLK